MKTQLQDVYLTREQFDNDLENCLTILQECKGFYLCEHISAGLEKRTVKIFIL